MAKDLSHTFKAAELYQRIKGRPNYGGLPKETSQVYVSFNIHGGLEVVAVKDDLGTGLAKTTAMGPILDELVEEARKQVFQHLDRIA